MGVKGAWPREERGGRLGPGLDRGWFGVRQASLGLWALREVARTVPASLGDPAPVGRREQMPDRRCRRGRGGGASSPARGCGARAGCPAPVACVFQGHPWAPPGPEFSDPLQPSRSGPWGRECPGGVACLPPALPRQQCSGPRALRRLERRAGVVGGPAGSRREGAFLTSSPQRCHGDCRGSLTWPAAALEAAATDLLRELEPSTCHGSSPTNGT